jgi:hypothetical protein
MEIKFTQAKANYSANHNIGKERAALFRRFRAVAGKQAASIRRRPTRKRVISDK